MSDSIEDSNDLRRAREYSLEIVKLFREEDCDPVLVYTALTLCMFSLAKSMNMPTETFRETMTILVEDYERADK